MCHSDIYWLSHDVNNIVSIIIFKNSKGNFLPWKENSILKFSLTEKKLNRAKFKQSKWKDQGNYGTVSLIGILGKIAEKAAQEFSSNKKLKEGNIFHAIQHSVMENKSFRLPCYYFSVKTKRCFDKITSLMEYI